MPEEKRESCGMDEVRGRAGGCSPVAPLATGEDLPECCGTGCAVCVLDYAEEFSARDAHLAGMLEAMEAAATGAAAEKSAVKREGGGNGD